MLVAKPDKNISESDTVTEELQEFSAHPHVQIQTLLYPLPQGTITLSPTQS